jgi:hypothetical protein
MQVMNTSGCTVNFVLRLPENRSTAHAGVKQYLRQLGPHRLGLVTTPTDQEAVYIAVKSFSCDVPINQ